MGKFSIANEKRPISEEVATEAVRDLIGYYHIDIDAIPDKKEREVLEAACEKLVGYYRMGLFENIRDPAMNKLSIKQHLLDPPGQVAELVYGKMGGSAKLATDGFDANDRYARIYAMLDKLSGSGSGTIAALSGTDLSAAEYLGTIFLLG